ncbi:hypothetical protein EVAR_91629_1 [Eumeta japonica]|uniref:Uncharacterized protein n=1 Tax=Eumeta variegata TaxID=151549 RepID=A0A4C1UWS3_EUMVA|nr:hypothetical protein EVAR_91629_1 [Eumeta japonica]
MRTEYRTKAGPEINLILRQNKTYLSTVCSEVLTGLKLKRVRVRAGIGLDPDRGRIDQRVLTLASCLAEHVKPSAADLFLALAVMVIAHPTRSGPAWSSRGLNPSVCSMKFVGQYRSAVDRLKPDKGFNAFLNALSAKEAKNFKDDLRG